MKHFGFNGKTYLDEEKKSQIKSDLLQMQSN